MFGGLRLSVGMALLGVGYAGIVPGASSPGDPIEVIGGSALMTAPTLQRSSAGAWIFTIAARADDALQRPGAVSQNSSGNVSVGPPSFSQIEIAADGRIEFRGIGTPGAQVSLMRHGQMSGSTVIASDGTWSLSVAGPLPVGEHLFSSRSNSASGGSAVAGGDVRIAIPSAFGTGAAAIVVEDAPRLDAREQNLRRRAEELAGAANERFSQIETERAGQSQSTTRNSRAAERLREQRRRIAAGEGDKTEGGVLFWLQDWLASANRDFQGKVVRRLQVPGPSGSPDSLAERSAPEKSAATSDMTSAGEDKARIATEAAAQDEARRIAAYRAAAAEEARKMREARERALLAAEVAERRRRAEAAGNAKDAAEADARDKAAAEARARAEAEQKQMAAARQVEVDRSAQEAARLAASKADQRRLREERERALLAAEIAERRRRAEAASGTRVADQAAAREKTAAEKAAAEARARAAADQRQATAQRQAEADRVAQEAARKSAAAANERRLRAERERALLDAEIAERQRRLEERQRVAAKTVRPEPPKPMPRESKPEAAPVEKPAASAPVVVQAAKPEPRRPALRGGDGIDDEPASSRGTSGRSEIAADKDDLSRRHVMPESWRLLEKSSIAGRRVFKSAERDESGTIGRHPSIVSADRRRGRGRACGEAGSAIDPPGTYVVRRGDSLWLISRRHYQRGARWPAIFRANDAKIDDPDLIFPCQRFHIPQIYR